MSAVIEMTREQVKAKQADERIEISLELRESAAERSVKAFFAFEKAAEAFGANPSANYLELQKAMKEYRDAADALRASEDLLESLRR